MAAPADPPAAKPHGVMLAFDSSSVEGANRIREQIEEAMAKAGLAMFSWRIVEKDAPDDERAKFVAWLRQDADQENSLIEFLADLPAGTNGARIRTDCKIRRDVKRALADEIEGGTVGR